jgi:glycine oxidase
VNACQRRGVRFLAGQPVLELERQGEILVAVRTPGDRHSAGQFVVSAGAWSHQLLRTVGVTRVVEPIRGQIVLLSSPVPPIEHIIEQGPNYLVPRPDGRTLVGSTEERAGFEKRNTPEAMRRLLDFAITMVPALAQAEFEKAWSGLRPHAEGHLPLIGRPAGFENLIVATGHFRWGLHLSPITARIVAELITGRTPQVDLKPFSPG